MVKANVEKLADEYAFALDQMNIPREPASGLSEPGSRREAGSKD
jgi:hypothetical protein